MVQAPIRLWKAYERQLQKRPVLTQAATSAVLFGAGDVVAQRMAEGRSNLDVSRTLMTSVFGGAVVGPLGHLWYSHLDKITGALGFVKPGSNWFFISKLLVDAICWNSLYIAAFFG